MNIAATTYTARAAIIAAQLKAIAAQLKAIEYALARHASQHAASPDWGFAGDLGHVHAQIAEIIRFLGSGS